MQRITATYLIETPIEIAKAAATLAGEQSSGTFVSVPGETEELKAQFAATVESIEELDTVSTPGVPGSLSKNQVYRRAWIKVSWSVRHHTRYLDEKVEHSWSSPLRP